MGLGKTVMIISLIVSNLGKTLIVCPLSLINQWENEIETHLRDNSLKTLVFYGNDR